jgi:hypothetical protein
MQDLGGRGGDSVFMLMFVDDSNHDNQVRPKYACASEYMACVGRAGAWGKEVTLCYRI